VLLLGGTVAGSVLYRRRSGRRLERIELYGADGAMVSIAEGTVEFERMQALARDLVALGR
jgi:ribosomal protein L27